MIKLSPYLNFDGNCAEAFAFYHRIFGGEPPMTMTYANSPMAGHFPVEWGSKVLHTRIAFDGNVLMGSDAPPGKFEKAQGITLALNPETPEEAERLFTALSEGGEGYDAAGGNLLGAELWRTGRSVRHSLDRELREEVLSES